MNVLTKVREEKFIPSNDNPVLSFRVSLWFHIVAVAGKWRKRRVEMIRMGVMTGYDCMIQSVEVDRRVA